MKSSLILIFFSLSSWGANEAFQTALKKMYPGCALKKEILYLTTDQKEKIGELAGVTLKSQLANRFKTCHDSFVYIDSHIVRTLNQTLIVEIKRNQVKTCKVSAFLEPQEYKAPDKWLAQLNAKALEDVVIHKKIDGLTGATLTAKANVEAVRRILALDRVLGEK